MPLTTYAQPGQVITMMDTFEEITRQYLVLDRTVDDPPFYALMNVDTGQYFARHRFNRSLSVRDATEEESARFARWHLESQ